MNLEKNLEELKEEIERRQYKLSPGMAFIIREPTVREIIAATFRDRVVHHLIYRGISEYWDKHFIYDSYSCRVGKGTHFGIKRMSRFMRGVSNNYTQEAWVMKLDIEGYFMHMRRELVWELCRGGLEKMEINKKEKELLNYLLPIVILANPLEEVKIKGRRADWDDLPRSKSLFYAPEGCGLPIGNLTSQLFSNIYLNELDKYARYELGFRYYGRYVDDFILMSRDKRRLTETREMIRDFFKERLGLTLHPKKMYLQLVKYGVDFLGARIRPYYVLPGKRLVKGFRKAEEGKGEGEKNETRERSYQSYLGHLGQFRSWRLREKKGCLGEVW